jgi:hypothetical protein
MKMKPQLEIERNGPSDHPSDISARTAPFGQRSGPNRFPPLEAVLGGLPVESNIVSHHAPRLPDCDRPTQRLEVAAFLTVGLMAGVLIFLAAGNAIRFGAGQDAIFTALFKPQGFEQKAETKTNMTASIPEAAPTSAIPRTRRPGATSPRT